MVTQKWTRDGLSFQELINPSGIPTEHGTYKETALNRVLKSATVAQIPSGSNSEQCGNFLALRALAELLAATQSMVSNSRCVHNIINATKPELWC